MSSPITDLEIRMYFASVVGAFRGPFGKRGAAANMSVGQSKVLAQNGTKDHAMSVTVTRSDLAGAVAGVIFTQNTDGSASNNDFPVAFAGFSLQRFVLKPGDTLSVQMVSGGPANFVVGQESW